MLGVIKEVESRRTVVEETFSYEEEEEKEEGHTRGFPQFGKQFEAPSADYNRVYHHAEDTYAGTHDCRTYRTECDSGEDEVRSYEQFDEPQTE